MTQFSIDYSEPDSNTFSLRCARAVGVTEADVPAVVRFAAEHQIRLVIARCDAESLSAVHAMEGLGFRLTDTLIYYRGDAASSRLSNRPPVRPIRLLQPRDRDTVLALARALFTSYFSHYHSDPKLDRRLVADGYRDWVARLCDRMDSERTPVFVADTEGQVAGFVTLRLNDADDGEMVIGGVAPAFAGQGLYSDFLRAGMDWCASRGRSGLVVSTQVTNYTVQRAWARLGFRMHQALYTLHGWFDHGETR